MSVSVETFKRPENTGYVEQATKDMSPAQIADIERRAKAQVSEMQVTTAAMEEAAHKAKAEPAPGTSRAVGNPEAKVYGEIIGNVLGVKAIGAAAEIFGVRHQDHLQTRGGHHDNIATASIRHIDDDIKGASRPAGVYTAEVASKEYGGKQMASPPVDFMKMGLGERTAIAGISLRDAGGEDNLKSWAKKPFEDFNAAASLRNDMNLKPDLTLAKNISHTLENANEAALESAKLAREQQNAMVYKANTMAPGMNLSLSNGPSINPAQLLSEAHNYAQQSSSGSGTYL